MPVNKKVCNDSTLLLNHPNYNAKLTFGTDHDQIAIISENQNVHKINFYGFKGYIKSPLFDEIQKRPSELREQLFADFLRSIKFSILKKMVILARHSPELVLNNRNIFVRIANDVNFGTNVDRLELGNEIPVKLLSVGWRKIKELSNKNVYVEVLTTTAAGAKAERAASMGYNMVCANTHTEMKLLERMINAKEINQLPDSVLKDISTIIHPTGKLKILLESAGEILSLLTQSKTEPITKLQVYQNIASNYVADSDMTISKTISRDYVKRNLKKINVKHPKRVYKQKIPINKAKKNCFIEDYLKINDIKLALCQMDREDINALANPSGKEIFININSPVIQKFIEQTPDVQKVLLMEEMSHELAHIQGYGLMDHDNEFFKIQRILKYKGILNL